MYDLKSILTHLTFFYGLKQNLALKHMIFDIHITEESVLYAHVSSLHSSFLFYPIPPSPFAELVLDYRLHVASL